jgi:hypothetical protein
MRSEIVSLFVLAFIGAANAVPHPPPPPPPPHQPPPPPVVSEPLANLTTTVTFQGHTFLNKVSRSLFVLTPLPSDWGVTQGQVAFGFIPSDFKDSTGETFGGVGSAITLERGSWKKNKDGTFSGVMVVQVSFSIPICEILVLNFLLV